MKRIESKQVQSPAMINFTTDGDQLGGDFPLLWGRRQWMLGTTDRDRSIVNVTKAPELEDRQRAPLPQLLLIKHGDFPLDLVKDYQFESADQPNKHPCMIIREPTSSASRRWMSRRRQTIAKFNLAKAPVYLDESMSGAIRAYLITGDAELGRTWPDGRLQGRTTVVDGYLKQTYLPTPGFAPHMRQQTAVCLLLPADAVIDGGQMAPEVRVGSRRKRRSSAIR